MLSVELIEALMSAESEWSRLCFSGFRFQELMDYFTFRAKRANNVVLLFELKISDCM